MLLVGTRGNHALDPTTGECFRLPGKDRTLNGAAVAWTGERLIVWSGGGGQKGAPKPYRRGGDAFVFDAGVTEA